jgi:hypothetical protein
MLHDLMALNLSVRVIAKIYVNFCGTSLFPAHISKCMGWWKTACMFVKTSVRLYFGINSCLYHVINDYKMLIKVVNADFTFIT